LNLRAAIDKRSFALIVRWLAYPTSRLPLVVGPRKAVARQRGSGGKTGEPQSRVG
jgi:hypothetical protein